MTKTLIAAAVAALITNSASAADVGYFASAEYTIEAEVFETVTGATFAMGKLTMTPAITLNDDGQNFDFASAGFTLAYDVTSAATAYATVETDADFHYSETTVGVAFKF